MINDLRDFGLLGMTGMVTILKIRSDRAADTGALGSKSLNSHQS